MPLITLNIHVDRIDEVISVYDVIEVWRSTSGEGGPYTEITDADGPKAAQVDGANSGGFNLDGEDLEITVDGAVKTVSFSGTDPLSLQSVIDQINAVVSDLASEVPTDTDQLRLTSPTKGTGSTLEVTAGTAATELGLSTNKAVGKAARIELFETTRNYQFLDLDGDNAYFYKTRFSNNFSQSASSFSDPRQGSAGVVAPQSELVTATAKMVNGAGEPIVGRSLRFFLQAAYNVDTTTYYAVPGKDSEVSATTDESGVATIDLLKGAKYRVVLEGTGYIREFTAPDSDFDLFSVVGSSPDPFDIAQAPARPIKVTI